jgi:transposase
MSSPNDLSLSLLPKAPGLKLDGYAFDAEAVSLSVANSHPSAESPICEQKTTRLHSHYRRTISDLPWGGRSVRLLCVRRFRCPDAECPRSIFAERLPSLVEPYARKTARLNEVLELVGFALGGKPVFGWAGVLL